MLNDPCCIGCPASLVTRRWDQHMKQEHNATFGPGIPAFNIGETMLNFLSLRMGSDSKPLSNKVVRMQAYAGGWVKCWLLPEDTRERLKHEGWFQAWHGSRFEFVYSIMYDSQLQPSWSSKLGHQCIYLRRRKNRHISEFTDMTRTDLQADGIFYGPLFEALVDRHQSFKHDAWWIQKLGSVMLSALWVHSSHWSALEEGMPVGGSWCPLREIKPKPFQVPPLPSDGTASKLDAAAEAHERSELPSEMVLPPFLELALLPTLPPGPLSPPLPPTPMASPPLRLPLTSPPTPEAGDTMGGSSSQVLPPAAYQPPPPKATAKGCRWALGTA